MSCRLSGRYILLLVNSPDGVDRRVNLVLLAMVDVVSSSLQTDSQSKSGGLVRGSAAAWRCSTFIR